MSPDSPETRISRLEQTVAALKQEVRDLGEDVRVFAPLIAQMATMAAHLEHVERSVVDLTRKMEERERDSRTESATERRWRVGTAVVIGLAFLGVVVQIYLAAQA